MLLIKFTPMLRRWAMTIFIWEWRNLWEIIHLSTNLWVIVVNLILYYGSNVAGLCMCVVCATLLGGRTIFKSYHGSYFSMLFHDQRNNEITFSLTANLLQFSSPICLSIWTLNFLMFWLKSNWIFKWTIGMTILFSSDIDNIIIQCNDHVFSFLIIIYFSKNCFYYSSLTITAINAILHLGLCF